MDLQLGDLVSSIWINFAKTGNPNGAGLPTWPAFDASTQVLLNFSDHPKAEKAPYGAALDFQDKVQRFEGNNFKWTGGVPSVFA